MDIYICIFIHIFVHIYTCIYIYIHTCTRTQMLHYIFNPFLSLRRWTVGLELQQYLPAHEWRLLLRFPLGAKTDQYHLQHTEMHCNKLQHASTSPTLSRTAATLVLALAAMSTCHRPDSCSYWLKCQRECLVLRLYQLDICVLRCAHPMLNTTFL